MAQQIKAGDATPGTQYLTRGQDLITAGDVIDDNGTNYRRVTSSAGTHIDVPMDYPLWVEDGAEDDWGDLVGLPEADLLPKLAGLDLGDLEQLADMDGRSCVVEAYQARLAAETDVLDGCATQEVNNDPPSNVVALPDPGRPAQPAGEALEPTATPGTGTCAACSTVQATSPQVGNETQLVVTAHRSPAGAICLGAGKPAVDPKILAAAAAAAAGADSAEPGDGADTNSTEPDDGSPCPWTGASTGAERLAVVKACSTVQAIDLLRKTEPADPPALQAAVRREFDRQRAALGRVFDVVGSEDADQRKARRLQDMLGQARTQSRPGVLQACTEAHAALVPPEPDGDSLQAPTGPLTGTAPHVVQGVDLDLPRLSASLADAVTKATGDPEARVALRLEDDGVLHATVQCADMATGLDVVQAGLNGMGQARIEGAWVVADELAAKLSDAGSPGYSQTAPTWDLGSLPWADQLLQSSLPAALELIAAQHDHGELAIAWQAVCRQEDPGKVAAHETLADALIARMEAVKGTPISSDMLGLTQPNGAERLLASLPGERLPARSSAQIADNRLDLPGEPAWEPAHDPRHRHRCVPLPVSPPDTPAAQDAVRAQQLRDLQAWLQAWPLQALRAQQLGLRMEIRLDNTPPVDLG